MRFKLILCTAMLPPALILAGCGMDTMSSLSPELQSPALSGRSFGGQFPIVGATIEVVAMGTSDYGSAGTILATTTTASDGTFQFASGAYSCPQPDTPVYLLGIGGDSGGGVNNPAIANAVGLGSCMAGKNSTVQMNEITTVALAFSLSHFFTTSIGDSNDTMNANGDWFGGPSTSSGGTIQYSRGLVLGNSDTIPALVSNAVGTPNQPHTGYVVDNQKIITIANILAACVNTSGSTKNGQACGQLFKFATPPSGVAPADTLQAAVQMALYPTQKLTQLYGVIGPMPVFGGGLSSVPNDWTIGVSYTTSSLGLAVNTGAVSTLDIDATGKVWFPSNAAGQVGAAYFDPASQTFNGPFNTSLVAPDQVAIDTAGYVWLNDTASSSVSGYLSTSPGTTQSFSLAATVSNALTIGSDDRVTVGTTKGSTYGLAAVAANRGGYTAQTQTFALPVTSMASDNVTGTGVATTDSLGTQLEDYYATQTFALPAITSKKDDSGQIIYTGNDFVTTRPYSGGTGDAKDGLCIFSQGACYNIKGGQKSSPMGIAIDGASTLWMADLGDNSVLQIPVFNAAATNGSAYLNANNKVVFNEFLHGPDSGPTTTMTAPMGIGIDAAGNVWVSNAGCTTTGCTPGSFTLTEIVGAATPTVVPVSSQIEYGLTGSEPLH